MRRCSSDGRDVSARRRVSDGGKILRGFMGIAASALVILAVPYGAGAAYAMERPESIDEATWARLQDDVLEYDEIADLVECYNPQYRQAMQGIEVNTQIFSETIDYLQAVAREENEEAGKARREGDMMQLVESLTQAKTASAMKKGLESGKNMVENGADVRYSMRYLRQTLTRAVQQLMINYDKVMSSQELSAAGVELAEAALSAAQTQLAAGMATEADVQAAQKALLNAQSQAQTLADTAAVLRQNLCLMTGWSYDATPQIGSVPAPDVGEIDSMNPADDAALAVSSSYTVNSLISQTAKGDTARKRKFRNMDEAKNEITTKLNEQYQTVLQCRTAYDAANTAYENARLTMEGNERKYRLGMLGELQYSQARLAYLQQQAATRGAALDLRTAMEDYRWSVEGIN